MPSREGIEDRVRRVHLLLGTVKFLKGWSDTDATLVANEDRAMEEAKEDCLKKLESLKQTRAKDSGSAIIPKFQEPPAKLHTWILGVCKRIRVGSDKSPVHLQHPK